MPNNKKRSNTVLFVDDSKLMRCAAERALSREFEVLLACDGREAVRLLNVHSDIQAVITDLSMPEMDGHELIAHLKNSNDSRRREMPVLVVTGSAAEDVPKKVTEAGVAGIMTKPFTPETLILRVKQILDPKKADEQTEAPVRLADEADVQPICIEETAERFQRRLRQTLALHLRHDLPLSVMQLKVVNLDEIESAHSDRIAESVMRFAQDIVGTTLREEDSVGRTSEDTFTMALPMTNDNGARALAERLQEAFCKKKIAVRGQAVSLQVEVSVCDPGLTQEEIQCLAAGTDRSGNMTNLIEFRMPSGSDCQEPHPVASAKRTQEAKAAAV